MGPNPNGPRSVSCDRAIRYSGFFGVRSVGPVGDFLDFEMVRLQWTFVHYIAGVPSDAKKSPPRRGKRGRKSEADKHQTGSETDCGGGGLFG